MNSDFIYMQPLRGSLGLIYFQVGQNFSGISGDAVAVELFSECNAAERKNTCKLSLAVTAGIEQVAQQGFLDRFQDNVSHA